MMFINNPEAFATIIEERRRDNGQYLADVTDATPVATTARRPNGRSPLLHLAPLVTAT